MSNIKRLLHEMPERIGVDNWKFGDTHPDYPRIDADDWHANKKITSVSGHDIYFGRANASIDPAGRFHKITVSDKDGNTKIQIEGQGKTSRGKTFIVQRASSNKNRSIAYHHVLGHLVADGHLDHVVSDSHQSDGSHRAYKNLLTDYGDRVKVLHKTHPKDVGKEVTAENIDGFRGKVGRFWVTKK